MKRIVYSVVLLFALSALTVSAGDKEHFTDYYYSAKNVITDLNALAADIEDAKPSKGLSPAKAKSYAAETTDIRGRLEDVLTYSDEANEINEGYILYIDKMIVALSISENYYETKDKQTRTKLIDALGEAEAQKNAIDAKWKSSLKKYGIKGK